VIVASAPDHLTVLTVSRTPPPRQAPVPVTLTGAEPTARTTLVPATIDVMAVMGQTPPTVSTAYSMRTEIVVGRVSVMMDGLGHSATRVKTPVTPTAARAMGRTPTNVTHATVGTH
jgi:hypothetical protein